MANVNRVILIGRLTRDPEPHTFADGGKVCNFHLAVNNRKKNRDTGEWEDDPVFIKCKAFDAERRKLASLIEDYCTKGKEIYVEGSLVRETWADKETGKEVSMLTLRVQDVQLLGKSSNQDEGGSRPQRAAAQSPDYSDELSNIEPDGEIPF